MNVMFPMRINFSSVFRELQNRADEIKAQVDFRSIAKSERTRLSHAALPVYPKTYKINIKA
jgi:hypothetical protein